jgi:hypothetical protein
MGDLNNWTDLMTRCEVGWKTGSEHKAHSKMASLFALPYIGQPDYDTVEFPSKKEIFTGAAECCQLVRAMQAMQGDCSSRRTVAANRCWWHEDDEQFTMDSRACRLVAAKFVRGGTLLLCRTQRVRSDARRNQGVCGIDIHGQGCQGLCAEPICTVSIRFLETECPARWVRSYTQPNPTRSCT